MCGELNVKIKADNPRASDFRKFNSEFNTLINISEHFLWNKYYWKKRGYHQE